jgi:hypothetical protein
MNLPVRRVQGPVQATLHTSQCDQCTSAGVHIRARRLHRSRINPATTSAMTCAATTSATGHSRRVRRVGLADAATRPPVARSTDTLRSSVAPPCMPWGKDCRRLSLASPRLPLAEAARGLWTLNPTHRRNYLLLNGSRRHVPDLCLSPGRLHRHQAAGREGPLPLSHSHFSGETGRRSRGKTCPAGATRVTFGGRFDAV